MTKKRYAKRRLHNDPHEDRNCILFWNMDKLEAFYKNEFARISEIENRHKRRYGSICDFEFSEF